MDTAENKPTGRIIRSPIELCSRNLLRPMYPLMIYLCYFCQKNSSEKDCFKTGSGRLLFSIQLCKNCVEFNSSIQDTACQVLHKQKDELKACVSEKV